ncbi:Gfo/Idh/MocA family oxidoreductase [Anaerotardibacter muris]|uniref:Gfo/Idh/MocA family oxidoreductase n=1 Tax=Anaerotardibacter muris TaxID=2941505 RepID=UPI00203ECFBF|nr:Gfo/Idh/MocA family oxidoreductase [Anaerotardibacter muris]
MKSVITYGTFDLLHYGHVRLLERAKALGDRLIVGVTSDSYDKERGKLNVHDSLARRMEAVRATGLADEVIVEEYEGQKIHDIRKYDIDIFAIGSDWVGKFDYLNEYCDVVYLERTKGVSSTELRKKEHELLRIGISGTGRIARRFIPEAHFVSGVEVVGAYNKTLNHAAEFAQEFDLEFATDNFEDFLAQVNTVYIASPHQFHFEQTMMALEAGKHVLCEKPFAMNEQEVHEAYSLAREKGVALVHGIKTAYCPAFEHLVLLAKSGRIGSIVDVDASFTKLEKPGVRELKNNGFGGSMLELSAYPLLAIVKLLGEEPNRQELFSSIKDGVDIFDRGFIEFSEAVGSFKVGLGAKTEGSLVITGTKGYIYVPAPWWKTSYFEMRFEDANATRKYFYSFDGDGLRYELLELVNLVSKGKTESDVLTEAETAFIVKMQNSLEYID